MDSDHESTLKLSDSKSYGTTTDQTSTLLSTGNGTTELESTTNLSSFTVTDITSTLSTSNLTDTDTDKSQNVTRELILKKQLMHDVQKLKIELSQKNLLIDTLKADHLNQMDDMEDKLEDTKHKRQIMQAQYETRVREYKNESEKKIALLKKELLEKIKEENIVQKKYEELSMKISGDTINNFVQWELSEDDYLEMKGKPTEQMTSQEFFNVKLYENTRSLQVQIEALHQRLEILSGDLRSKDEELEQIKKDYDDERLLRGELDLRCQRFQVQIEELRGQVSQKSYKNQHFDLVQSERDELERQIVDLERMCSVYKAELEGKTDQMETVRNQMLEQHQTLALLKQDKEYLSKQVNEITPRFQVLEEKLHDTSKQLDDAKLAREELYEKYLNSREHYKREYEERMRREIDGLSTKTNNELSRIKDNTKEMYERENRSLREAKSQAVLEQQRMSAVKKELQRKYNELLGEFRQLQISSDSKVSDCQNEIKRKSFELDRVQLLHEESLRNAKEMGVQNDTLAKKFETINKEYFTLKCSTERTITELNGKHEQLYTKLTIYEKLEQELDDVVMQAAEITNEEDSERVLFAYGYGANVPSTAKRRMQQSVQLARRVLHLERTNTSLRHDVERETKKRKQIEEELENSTSLLNEAQQPYNYLIDSIRTRDQHNKTLKNTIVTLKDDLKTTKEDHQSLKVSHDQISADLERLLNQREEMNVLKQVVMGLKSSYHDPPSDSPNSILKTSSSKISKPRTTLSRSTEKPVVGKPFVFTNSEPPSWYVRLKQQNMNRGSLK